MNIKDFTYGIQAEKQRDLSKTMAFFKYIQQSKRPIRVNVVTGQSYCMFVNGFDDMGKRVILGNFSDPKLNRVIIPVDYIVSVEQSTVLPIDVDYKGRMTIRRGDLEAEGYEPSGRDFFQVIRFAYQQNKPIRVYLSNGRTIEGVSTGMDEQSVGIRVSEDDTVQVFYDWVDQIVPV